MSSSRFKLLSSLLLLYLQCIQAYSPVFFMHGLTGDAAKWNTAIERLEQAHPGQVAISLNVNNGIDSFKIMSEQVEDIISAIKSIIQANSSIYAHGFHLVGHSQGGLLTRAVLMQSGFPIINYVSCAGPHYGVYGNYTIREVPLTPPEITDLVYTREFQNSDSFANYWHDAENYTRYTENALWLSTLNNETFNPNSEAWKRNFLSANVTVFNISPQDGVVFPWISAVFGFWAPNLTHVVEMSEQPIFIKDSFGLQTALNRGSLTFHIVPNAKHEDWLHSAALFDDYILPYLT